MTDMVNHPPHYTAYSIEVIEVTRYCQFDGGNAIKYMLRHLHKGTSKQDLNKALWYLNDHIEEWGGYLPVLSGAKPRKNLSILAREYGQQENAIPDVENALVCLVLDDVLGAQKHLETAISSL